MVIVRNVKAGTYSASSTDDHSRHKQRFGRRIDLEASLGSQISGSNVEICQVGEEICAVPIELFEMADLKKILSLETWNFCLTEEERESLCAYLPNLDEEAYRQTLKELFEGENFHFGSPMADLFRRLKGGLCHPHVVRYKEGLKYLQRKHHYHSLRKHHNRMVNQFLEMQSLWQQHPHASLEERIELWDSWKLKKAKESPYQIDEKKNSLLRSRRMPAVKTGKMLIGKGVDEAATTETKGVFDLDFVSNHERSHKEFENARPSLTNNADKRAVKNGQVLKVEASETAPVSRRKREGLLVGNADNLPLHDSVFCDVSANDMPEKSAMKGKTSVLVGKHKQLKQDHESIAGKMEHGLSLNRKGFKKEVKPMENYSLQEEIQEMEEEKSEQLSDMDDSKRDEGPRKTYTRSSRIIERSMNQDGDVDEEEKRIHGVDMDISSEERSQATADENIKGVEPSKKLKRTKSKEKNVLRTSWGGASNKVKLDDLALDSDEEEDVKMPHRKQPKKQSKKKSKGEENGSQSSFVDVFSVPEKVASGKTPKKPLPPSIPAVVLSLPFSVIHLLSAVRTAMIIPMLEEATELGTRTERASENLHHGCSFMTPDVHYSESNVQVLPSDNMLDMKTSQEEGKSDVSGIAFSEIVKRVQTNPGDPRILKMPEPLQGLVRGVLRVLSSKTSPPKIKGWKPFVAYHKEVRVWSWIGPVPPVVDRSKDVNISADAWGVSEKTLLAIQEFFANWLKHAQDTLQQLGQLSLSVPPVVPVLLDEKERFRDLKAQKSLATISPSSEEMRAYFRKEEVIRYAVPDRAFTYTTADGKKSVVAPIKRIGGKPNAKVRDHVMLKSDRPSHVTLLCLVRDAAARLPGGIGTRADVCALIRDSQYLVEDVSDAQLNQVVSGALDRLHYERDPCIRFDSERKLWVYLHTHRDEDDFEDDGTSSAKRWKRSKKEGPENQDLLLSQDYLYPGKDDQDLCNIGLDFSSPSCFEEHSDFSVYSTGRPELVYNNQASALGSPHVLANGFPGQVRDDGVLPFIDLPPSIQPPCVNMQQSHPMGWEVLGSSWNQEPPFHSRNHLLQEDFSTLSVPLYAVKPGQ